MKNKHIIQRLIGGLIAVVKIVLLVIGVINTIEALIVIGIIISAIGGICKLSIYDLIINYDIDENF